MSAPLYSRLKEYSEKGCYPFHMPGHKMGRGLSEENLFAMDITEIEGFDNLHQPEGIIKDAQDLAAKTFGAKETFFLVNGSSCGIIASIMATCADKAIILGRNSHKSAFDAMIYSGAQPVYVMPQACKELPVFGTLNPEDIDKACAENSQAGAVMVVSPTYEGIVSDIQKIAEIVHRHQMVLIVDEAHGAHLSFHDYFPRSAVDCGADIVIQSLHKTLPCPTQTGLLHVCSDRVDICRLKRCISMAQSTSPSYVLMGMIDRCRDYLDQIGESQFKAYVFALQALRKEIQGLKNLRILTQKSIHKDKHYAYDRSKLVIFSKNISGIEIGRRIEKKGTLALEMICPTHVIAMTSVCDSEKGFWHLIETLKEIDREIAQEQITLSQGLLPCPKVVLSPRRAFGQKSHLVSLPQARGRISAQFLIPYPPGIPLLSPGEEITEEVLSAIAYYHHSGISLMGNIELEKVMILE